jgi:hypothetical protein
MRRDEMTTTTICEAVREALTRRDSRRDLLAETIRRLAEEALYATRRRRVDLGSAGVLEYRVPMADHSEWSSRIDFPAARGEPALMLVVAGEIRSLGPPPGLTFRDARGVRQPQRGPTRDATTGRALRPATVTQLRAVARALPEALAALLAGRLDEAEAGVREADAASASLDPMALASPSPR